MASIGGRVFSGCTALTKLESLNATPPTCEYGALTDIDKEKCTLYVPQNSFEAYKAADQWKEFFNIEGVEDTGISMPNCNGTNKVIKRYNTSGRLINEPTKGLNIVKMSDGTTKKVMVK